MTALLHFSVQDFQCLKSETILLLIHIRVTMPLLLLVPELELDLIFALHGMLKMC